MIFLPQVYMRLIEPRFARSHLFHQVWWITYGSKYVHIHLPNDAFFDYGKMDSLTYISSQVVYQAIYNRIHGAGSADMFDITCEVRGSYHMNAIKAGKIFHLSAIGIKWVANRIGSLKQAILGLDTHSVFFNEDLVLVWILILWVIAHNSLISKQRLFIAVHKLNLFITSLWINNPI